MALSLARTVQEGLATWGGVKVIPLVIISRVQMALVMELVEDSCVVLSLTYEFSKALSFPLVIFVLCVCVHACVYFSLILLTSVPAFPCVIRREIIIMSHLLVCGVCEIWWALQLGSTFLSAVAAHRYCFMGHMLCLLQKGLLN